jgi:hypothetical protein
MAEYTRRVRTRTTVEYVVPVSPGFGACWSEVMKAIAGIHNELRTAGRLKEHQDASDDMIRFTVEDDAVIVFYERDDVSDA